MLPSRNYTPSYPPPRSQGQGQGQPQPQQQHQQPNLYQQGPLPTYVLQPLSQQQQGQGQQQPQQGGDGGGVNGNANGVPAGVGGGLGGEMNLASVLHYLQSEWRRWERDRNEWEIERAEMRARIALLEGQRRSAENLKVDLLRRVKMLEFALRQERTKSVGTAGKASGIAPSKLATLQEDDRSSNNEKEGSDSGGSGASDRDENDRKMNGHAGSSKMSVMSKSSSDSNSGANTWKSVGAVPRDPKSRARSREYLKQCLQEITYLTSPGALNPLPPRPLLDEPESIDYEHEHNREREPERPTKALPTRAVPSMFARKEDDISDLPNGSADEVKPPSPPPMTDAPRSHLTGVNDTSKPPSSPLVHTRALPDDDPAEEKMAYPEQSKQLLTAIYRPESKSAWRQELQTANDHAERAQRERTPDTTDGPFSQIALNAEKDRAEEAGSSKSWKPRITLRGHLDTVRSVAIASGQGMVLATGGDDNTVKLWRVNVHRLLDSRLRRDGIAENETFMTYRGHSAAITSVLVSSALQLVFSASLDSTIRIWKLPSTDRDPYGSYDPSLSVQKLIGHTETIWDLCLLPNQSGQSGVHRLASASADGTVKVWTSEGGRPWSLLASVGDFGDGVPICLGVYHLDYTKLLIGLSDGAVQVYNVDKQTKEVVFQADVESRVNSVLSHPTLPIIVSAHEDGNIRIYDIPSEPTSHDIKPKETLFAHPSPITSLTISPASPMEIISASTTCVIRVWDLVKGVSVQDIESHRGKGGEGVTKVEGHPDLPIMASSGADGVVRLWAAT